MQANVFGRTQTRRSPVAGMDDPAVGRAGSPRKRLLAAGFLHEDQRSGGERTYDGYASEYLDENRQRIGLGKQ